MAIRFLAPWFKMKKKTRRSQVFEGLTKNLFQGEDSGTYIMQFKDQIESADYLLHSLPGKGAIANRFSEMLMKRFEEIHVPTHFLKQLNMYEQLIKPLEMLPFKVVTHNHAVGDLSARLGIDEFSELERPIVEFHMKLRHQRDKLITSTHLDSLNWLRQYEVDYLYFIAARINDNLLGQFQALGLRLLNFSMEFGRYYSQAILEEPLILLADDLAPENFLVQDVKTGEVLHIFDEKEGKFILNTANYLEISKRFGVIPAFLKEDNVEVNNLTLFSTIKEKE